VESKPDEPGSASASATRLIVFYVALAVLTAVVSFVVIKKGADEKPQPAIAAGYDASAPNPCLGEPARPATAVTLLSTAPAQAPQSGPSFDLKQSG